MSLVHRRPVNDGPFIVQVDDADLDGFLRGLPAPSVHSQTQGQLWALPLTDAEADAVGLAGSAYLVSGTVMRRVQAGRTS